MKQVAKKAVKAVAKHGDAISITANIVSVGLCATGVGCLAGAAIAAGIGAGVAAAQSYDKHGDLGRAATQAGGSIAVDMLTGSLYSKISKIAKLGPMGLTAINLHGIPPAFLAGMGVEAGIDKLYSSSGG